MPDITDQILNDTARATGDQELAPATPAPMQQTAPLYRVIGEAIPVSQSTGKLWASRKDGSIAKMTKLGYYDNWDEAIRYFRNDQATQRATSSNTAARPSFSRRSNRNQALGDNGTGIIQDSENIVFSNTSSLVPMLYAKNPVIEVTPAVDDPDNPNPSDPDNQKRQLAVVTKKLVNALMSKKAAPGVNLKPKARKSIIMGTLTNIGYIETFYTQKENSQENALQQLQELSANFVNAQSPQEIETIEGQLQSLEEEIDMLAPSGPGCRFKHPKDVLRDPDSVSDDLSDDKYIMIGDYVSTSWLHAKYYIYENGEYKSLFQATHVAQGDTNTESTDDITAEINNFNVLKQSNSGDYRSYGYKDKDTFDAAKRTRVWYVWDKTTRRVYLFNDKDWSWPIWVWNDPYNLEGFFPISVLQFYTDPEECIGPAEVSMYLDQQDSINQINNELAKMRNRAINLIFYNENIFQDKTTLDAMLNGNKAKAAVGFNLPPEVKLIDGLVAGIPPSAGFDKLFDKTQIYSTIDRLSSVSDVMRGEQFKTNTTNQAINTYNSNTQTRLDEKIDAVEDFIGDIGWKIAQLCLQFMPAEQVAGIIGMNAAQGWTNLKSDEIITGFAINTVGGSTQKPTSIVKKQEALQVAQALGQFGQAGGGVTILTALQLMSRAFDDLVVTQKDWQTIEGAIMQNLNRGNNAPPDGQQPPQGDPQQEQQMLSDPKVQQVIKDLVSKGMPQQQAEQAVLQKLQQQQQGAQ